MPELKHQLTPPLRMLRRISQQRSAAEDRYEAHADVAKYPEHDLMQADPLFR